CLQLPTMALKLVVRHAEDAPDSPSAATYAFAQTRVVIGRGAGADVRLPQRAVSDAHALVEESLDRVLISDQGSTNGTRVNGVALVPKRARALLEDDVVEIGDFLLEVSASPLHSAETTKDRTASLAKKLLCDLRGPADAVAAAPRLRVEEGEDEGTALELPAAPSVVRIGRDLEAELCLVDVDVSRFHVAVERDLDGTLLRDLDSKNGVEVNGKRVRERRLRDGDRLRIGGSTLLFEDLAERGLRALEGQADEPVTRTRTQRVHEAAASADAAPSPVVQAPTLPPSKPAGVLDVAVYALALAILSASMLGLWWLLRS
ncbi:MAG: hypothetical protein RL385_4338, partial [Pseudomonadota bacterium]